jgi:hypothetical protein
MSSCCVFDISFASVIPGRRKARPQNYDA